MKYFRLMLRAEGIEVPNDEPTAPPALGYVTTRFARGLSEGAASYRAIAAEWDAWVGEGWAEVDRGQLTLYADQSVPVTRRAYARAKLKAWRRGRVGRTFWDTPDDDPEQPTPPAPDRL